MDPVTAHPYPDGWRDAIRVGYRHRTPEQRATVHAWRRARRARVRARWTGTTWSNRAGLIVGAMLVAVVLVRMLVAR